MWPEGLSLSQLPAFPTPLLLHIVRMIAAQRQILRTVEVRPPPALRGEGTESEGFHAGISSSIFTLNRLEYSTWCIENPSVQDAHPLPGVGITASAPPALTLSFFPHLAPAQASGELSSETPSQHVPMVNVCISWNQRFDIPYLKLLLQTGN